MAKLDEILKEAGRKSNDLGDLLQTPGSPDDDAVYKRTQEARFADYDALIAKLRGPEPKDFPQPEVSPLPPTLPSPFFPKPLQRVDVRFNGLSVTPNPDRPGILLPTAAPKTATPATMPQAFSSNSTPPRSLVKPVQMPR